MAITTETHVANLALSRIGQKPIADIAGTDAAAVACERVFAMVRQEILGEWRWKFATKRAVLAENASATERDEWEYIYNLPSDFVSAHYIATGARDEQVERDGRIPFALEYDAQASHASKQVLLTDVEPETDEAPLLVYTFDQSTVTTWPSHFKSAVAWRLAAEACLPLSIKADRARLAFDMAEASLAAAIAKEQRTVQADPPPESEFTTARGG